jgi:hypothetical protein
VFEAASIPTLEPETTQLKAYNFFELLHDPVVIKPRLNRKQTNSSLLHREHTVTVAHISLVESMLTKLESNKTHMFGFSLSEGHSLIRTTCAIMYV